MSKYEAIIKSNGLNKAEEYLTKMCEKTFLSLWGYANVYRKPRKELCDLLVVFGNYIIIFSDKSCQFKTTKNIDIAWKQWFRRAVKEPADDLWGAERWIKQFPEKIFLDRNCTQKLPYPLPDINKAEFHLIVVTHQISHYCKELFGGSGSLMISNDIKGFLQHTKPFTIGDLNPQKTFIHVLDDTSFNILMQARDTIHDFVDYLQKKETFLRSGKAIFATGEEDLLASYLKTMNKKEEHDFVFSEDYNGIALVEGLWENFQTNPQHIAQIAADKISYFWDELIEQFNKHALAGTQEYVWPQSFDTSERIVRFLATPSRFERRFLAGNFWDAMENTPVKQRRIRVIVPSAENMPYFVFLIFPFRKDYSYEINRQTRLSFLDACCRVVKLQHPNAIDIVGIATESGRIQNESGSEDACYLDARVWSEKNNIEAKELQSKLSILINPSQRFTNTREYPNTK